MGPRTRITNCADADRDHGENEFGTTRIAQVATRYLVDRGLVRIDETDFDIRSFQIRCRLVSGKIHSKKDTLQ